MFMQSIEPDLDSFLGDLTEADTATRAWQQAIRYFNHLGIDGLIGIVCQSRATGEVGATGPLVLAEAEPALAGACTDPAHKATDPVLLHLSTALRPLTFTLHEAARDVGTSGAGVAAVAARAGYTGLMAVPARCCALPCVSGVILLSRQDAQHARTLFHNRSIQMAFAAIQTHARLRQLWQLSAVRRAPETSILTRREREVLGLSAHGLTTREVGERLGISVSGVNFHIANAAKKLGANNRTHATSLALSAGLISV